MPTSADNDFQSSSVPQPSSSQETESTITLKPPSQNVEENDDGISPTSASVECQTSDGIFLTPDEYEELIQKSAENIDIENDLEKLNDLQTPVMDPNEFESMCMQAGAAKLFTTYIRNDLLTISTC